MNTITPQHEPRRRGVAMLLTLIAVATAVILSATFLSAQSTTNSIARTIDRQSQARCIAESALDLAITYIRNHHDWRAAKADGEWVTSHSLLGGTFTLKGEDGSYDASTGAVVGDGSLSDDAADPLTLTAVATYDGATHLCRIVVQEIKRLLMIVPPGTLSANDTALRSLFLADGWTVTALADNASDAAYQTATQNIDAVYIAGSASAAAINTRLNNLAIGVVSENPNLADDMSLIAPGDATTTGTAVKLSGSTHYVQQGFAGTSVSLAPLSLPINRFTGALASDVIVLATEAGTSTPTMLAIDAGGTDFGDRFVITGGIVVPQTEFGARITVVGSFISIIPVTMQLRAGTQTYEPFGAFTNPSQGNVNDNHNPRQFVLPTNLPAGTGLTIKAKSWISGSTGLLTIDSNTNSPNVKVLRDGDVVPSMQGAAGQISVAQVVQQYVNTTTGRVTLAPNQAIYLFELFTTDLHSSYADFQDLVVVVTLGTSRASLAGTAPARRLFLPFARTSPDNLSADGRRLLLRSTEWVRRSHNVGYSARWEEQQ